MIHYIICSAYYPVHIIYCKSLDNIQWILMNGEESADSIWLFLHHILISAGHSGRIFKIERLDADSPNPINPAGHFSAIVFSLSLTLGRENLHLLCAPLIRPSPKRTHRPLSHLLCVLRVHLPLTRLYLSSVNLNHPNISLIDPLSSSVFIDEKKIRAWGRAMHSSFSESSSRSSGKKRQKVMWRG